MIETTAIRNINDESLSIIWDTGRRCNYDCTYCEATRHNNHSQHKTLEEFKHTFNFIKQWHDEYNTRRRNPAMAFINFTGGEPTANPNFWKLVDYVKQYPDYGLCLTTNGAWHKKYSKKIIENFKLVTVSYHAEAHPSLKENVIENIIELFNNGMKLQVNVMLHVDYWDETVAVYKDLKSRGINCHPRPIGDGNIVRKGWFVDSDGTNRRTSHEYSIEQQQWFWNEMGIEKTTTDPAEGGQLGRACCGSKALEGKVNGQWQTVKLVNTQFEDWYCLVDWFFLYIDQETGNVFHHQTCKAFFEKTSGPIGNLDNANKMILDLKQRLSKKEITPIICPNKRCGCGMCVPKAKDFEDFKKLQQEISKQYSLENIKEE